MNITFFSPLLILLITTLLIKGAFLFLRIQEQTSEDYDASVNSVLVDTAYAQESAPEKPKEAGNTEEHKKAATKELDQSKADPVIPHKGADVTDSLSDIPQNVKAANPVVVPGVEEIPNLSASEIKLLKELSKRRQALDHTQDSLNVKEQVLKATETKLDQKIAELKTIQSQLKDMMKEYDQKEHNKITSLVKIYENMKPRDAAKIMDELEMPLLVQVVSNMKEAKVAPILASMNSIKARDLSMELAKQKQMGGQ